MDFDVGGVKRGEVVEITSSELKCVDAEDGVGVDVLKVDDRETVDN